MTEQHHWPHEASRKASICAGRLRPIPRNPKPWGARGRISSRFGTPAAVRAEALPDGQASIRVLEKLGMTFAGATNRVLRWRLERQDFEKGGRR